MAVRFLNCYYIGSSSFYFINQTVSLPCYNTCSVCGKYFYTVTHLVKPNYRFHTIIMSDVFYFVFIIVIFCCGNSYDLDQFVLFLPLLVFLNPWALLYMGKSSMLWRWGQVTTLSQLAPYRHLVLPSFWLLPWLPPARLDLPPFGALSWSQAPCGALSWCLAWFLSLCLAWCSNLQLPLARKLQEGPLRQASGFPCC